VDHPVPAEIARELRQPQRVERARDDLGVRVVRQPLLGEARAQPLVEAPVSRVEDGAGETLGRVLGMEVEGEPGDVGVELAPEPLGQRLAEPAERSDVVGPDEDLVCGGHYCSNARRSATVSRRLIARASPSATSTAAGRGTAL
jgi:hypothetical protein